MVRRSFTAPIWRSRDGLGIGNCCECAGNAYVTGFTSSLNFPQATPVQTGFNGLSDAFVSELNFAGNGLIFSTYYGGTGSDVSNSIVLDSNANIFVGGQTSSLDLHLVTPIQSASAASSTDGSCDWV